MGDLRVGAAFRGVRLRRGWRQADVAARGGVSRGFVSLVERGHLDRVSLATLRRVGAALDIRIDVIARWRGGALDRMLNARHSRLANAVVADVATWGIWDVLPEVSFSIYGERGIIDLLAFHAPSGSLLVIELKTEIVDVNELIGTHDRKARLAAGIASQRGWDARTVSRWLIVSRSSTNLRRIQAHRSVLRAAYPDDGRVMRGWLRDPTGPVRALSTWSDATPGSARPSARRPWGRRSAARPARVSVATSDGATRRRWQGAVEATELGHALRGFASEQEEGPSMTRRAAPHGRVRSRRRAGRPREVRPFRTI